MDNKNNCWSKDIPTVLQELNATPAGLTNSEAENRRKTYGLNTIQSTKRQTTFLLFLSQFKSPITIILLLAAALSYALSDNTDAVIIVIIVLLSSMLGFWQEKAAGNAIAQLLAMVRIKATVIRNNKSGDIPVEEIVPGDVILLHAGDLIPADCLIMESSELFIDEATFTGETFPVEKLPGVLPEDTVLAKRTNALFMGSHVISGTAKALVVKTGTATEFGHISQSLKTTIPETEFAHGIRKFGYLLMQITMIMVILIFTTNVMLHKPILESLLFTLAIAVGLTPQLLPAIITVNMASGARRMAAKQVIVKRLSSIENFGSMDTLCSDKTGTLTEGKVKVHEASDCYGQQNNAVLALAKMNSTLQQGFKNPIDEAIAALDLPDFHEATRLDEIPYDFIRKRLTLLVQAADHPPMLITKGALNQVTAVCNRALNAAGAVIPIEGLSTQIQQTYESLSAKGYRTLGIAYKDWKNNGIIHKEDEKEMIFAGFVSLYDPPKAGIADTINELRALGIQLKVITGDNALIAKNMTGQIGMPDAVILTGAKMRLMSDEALLHQVLITDVFAEVEPNHKERIILALKKAGKVVGYMGDGINDASALHAADVGLSVDSAVDVAKEAAAIVLLNQDLNVLLEGVKEGRRTFANTQKYIFMATSANFGNMFSMAGASLFLSFLPLLPKQILLTNLMTDLPAMALAADTVDDDWISKPRRWDIGFIKRFMLTFGILSSVFDYLTFGVLLLWFKAGEQEFQTGWFIESVVSATLIVLVVRTRKRFTQSKPGKYLFAATLFVALFTLLLPLLPFAHLLGFVAVPLKFYLAMLGIVALYILSAELTKKWFYKNYQ
ncbi:Mg2+-importing ATPase [Chitinophaga niastensis]|uniref:Magnesium-transporting ATPase, P-type 1 n=2 Tax=Chitinophaga niastensis TaxID=536980 RepID=A0A2P8HNW2_CHINA|nr:Mg2+-importing ATPase [Chitinophaga niastensis]